MSKILYTIGHSNRSLEEFLEILAIHKINRIVDVRSIPMSRHVPWFNQDNLKSALAKNKISYTHMPQLGGRRRTSAASINTGWRNSAFRGFADYMQTRPFFEALKKLNSILKGKQKVAIMCAEAVPWRCHRSLIVDAEIIRHFVVWEILSKTSKRPHQLTSFAVVDRTKKPIKLFYPANRQNSLFEDK